MAGEIYVEQQDLEARFGVSQVLQVFGDNGEATPGARLPRACRSASRLADTVLMQAWPLASIPTLVAEDDSVLDAICDIALAEGMIARVEWAGDETPYVKLRKDALTRLGLVATAKLRSAGETVAGKNPHLSMGKVSTQRTPHTFVFAPSRAKPRRGGF
jgi:phage gp36-like protein